MPTLLLNLLPLLSLSATGVLLALLLNARRSHAAELRSLNDRLHCLRRELNDTTAATARLSRRLRTDGLDADAHARSGRSEGVALFAAHRRHSR